MTHLANQMKALMEKNGMRMADVHRDKGVALALLSRLLHGEQNFISDKDFANISAAIAKSKQEQALLVRARMLDQCRGPGSELVEVVVKGAMTRERLPRLPVEPKLRRVFAHLMKETENNQHLVDALTCLARLIGMEENGGKPH